MKSGWKIFRQRRTASNRKGSFHRPTPNQKVIRSISILSITLLLSLLAQSAAAKDLVTGTLIFGPTCPSSSAQLSANEFGLAGGLLTPLLTGVINQGLKTAGAKLTEASEEKSGDVIHRGGHLYRWSGKEFELNFGCLIVASKGTKSSGRTLQDLVAGYQETPVNLTATESAAKDDQADQPKTLVELLRDAGFSDSLLPGILGVFDVELSPQRDAARLVPRFVVMDHSIREKRADKKERTMTFEVALTIPGKPFGQLLIKHEKLTIAKPFEQNPQRPLTSSWFSLPTLDAQTAESLKAFPGKKGQREVALETAKLAGAAAVQLGDPKIGPYLKEKFPCPDRGDAWTGWSENHAALEEAKPSGDKKKIARFDNAARYYQNCRQAIDLKQQLDKTEEGFKRGAGAFDITVTVKEFRKRPFAEFFGAVLSSDSVRSGLTSAFVEEFDPQTTAEAEEKAEAEALALRQAYEESIIAAEIAIATHNAALAEAKAAAYVAMEAAKRKANRTAQAIDLPAPYPQSGLWF